MNIHKLYIETPTCCSPNQAPCSYHTTKYYLKSNYLQKITTVYKIGSIVSYTILTCKFPAVIVRTLWKAYELSFNAAFCNQYVQHHPWNGQQCFHQVIHQVDIFGKFGCIMLYCAMHGMVGDCTSLIVLASLVSYTHSIKGMLHFQALSLEAYTVFVVCALNRANRTIMEA